MYALDKTLRSKLESTITKAREIAETASKVALEQLGVEQSSPYSYLTEEQRELRRKLRSHGRQMGDVRDPKEESQEIDRLIEEVAYEHWHRMLFARFLAENKLLMFYEEDEDIENAVAVTLEECEEMAQEMGFMNGWELASKLAAKMLPQIFRPDSPVFMLHFSPEKQKELENLLAELPQEVYTVSDSLGWVYQFWQTKKKKEINESGNKISARELPAVTQLFTEPYMVSFLLDNSLGAWWTKRKLTKDELISVSTEEELRKMVSLPGVPFEYLRFVKDKDGYWTPAVESYKAWPEKLSQLKTLDPCCGSGHFLVSAFQMLVSMRMELEGLSAKEACDAVIKENIHGLEIDQRCVELAAFAMALAAWTYPDAGGFRRLPELQIAWCGQSVNVKKEDWLALAEDDSDLKIHLEGLYNLFQDAPVLGSLLNPRNSFKVESLFENDWEKLNQVMLMKLGKKKNDSDEIGIVAQGMEKAFQILGNTYNLVMTNVPYLKGGNHGAALKDFCEKSYPNSKYDLATVFIERIQSLLKYGGVSVVVTQQYWLFLKFYHKMRKYFLDNYKLNLIARLGPGAFEGISGEVVNVCLQIIENNNITNDYVHYGFDLDKYHSTEIKKEHLKNDEMFGINQKKQLDNPDHRISFEILTGNSDDMLSKFADFGKGSVTGDGAHYLRYFWEFDVLKHIHRKWLNSPANNKLWSGRENVVLWGDNFKPETEIGFAKRGDRVFGKKGIAIGKAGKLRFTPYLGELFDDNIAVISPNSENNLLALWSFCTSEDFESEVRKLDKKMSITAGTFTKVHYDHELWRKKTVNQSFFTPYSNDPTQWIFHGHPAFSESPLQVAVARLLGYRWPAEFDGNMELSNEARKLIKKCDELLSYADKDGIVCIPPVRGEASAADRLLNLLAEAYKGQDINAKVSELLAECDNAGKSLESWFRNKFFTQHFKLFGHRPFILHIWDGLPNGFAALVNYHNMDRKKLETLIYTYLGDWISKQKAEITSGVDGAQEKLAAAEILKRNLELILHGDAPYDIFIRWKPVHMQPIGWEPDTNDGVRLNIRPFMSVPDVDKKGAGVLRDKPNIKWEKDRGKDTASSPWVNVFNGDRINDHHLTLDEKRRAREEKR